MDDDVELIIPDNLDEPQHSVILTDFSQVQIQVHGADVAEKFLSNFANNPEDVECVPAEYLDEEFDNDVQVISDDDLEVKQENVPENRQECLTNQTCRDVSIVPDIEEFTMVPMVPDTQKYANVAEVPGEEDCTPQSEIPDNNFDDIERIPDKEISKYDAVIEEYPDFYENMAIKEEIEPFMGTDYTDFDAGSSELKNKANDELPPEDIYHFNSKIILGSKPCSSTSGGSILRQLLNKDVEEQEEIDIEQENLNAFVLLEDWDMKLKNSQSFCKECGRLFATPNALDAHNTSFHSFLVPVNKNVAFKSTTKPAYARKSTGAIVVKSNKNIARKSTGSKLLGTKFCNHCNNVFPDHDSLIKHLYDLLTLKQFKCTTCNIVFKSKKDLTTHNAIHVKSEKLKEKNEKIEKEDFKTKLVYEEDVKKKRLVSPKKGVEALPTSILFQCPTCGVHFLSSTAGMYHMMYCNPDKPQKTTSCKMCSRKFFYKRIVQHRKQHKVCSKFKVYKLTKNMHQKTLCKCLNCGLHFTDMGLTVHLKSCGKIPSAQCQKCNILLPNTKIESHMNVHAQLNVKPKDFIIVHHVIQTSPVKRKLEPISTPTKKIKVDLSVAKIENETNSVKVTKRKKEQAIDIDTEQKQMRLMKKKLFAKGTKIPMYFCQHCKSCFRKSTASYHLKKICKSNARTIKVICTSCGLQYNQKTILSHMKLHRKRKLTVSDMRFYQVGTLKKVIPSIPDYPQCANCKIKFFDVKMKINHICGEDYETCKMCSEKFHNSAYDAHIEFHKLGKSEPKPKLQPKPESKLMPELIKKYESLNMMWNIVYLCKICEIVTDQYDNAVEHSQGHLNNKPTTKNIKCYICNLKFDETCWSKHSELHSRININSKDFKILSYNPRKLLTEEWLELFDTVPEEQIRQITGKSAYSNERRFNVKILKDGRSEFTLYCCNKCKVCCRDNEIEKHINGPCRGSDNVCKTCSIPFCDISTLRNHQILHLKGISKEEFRVVMFTKAKYSGKAGTKAKVEISENKHAKAKYGENKEPNITKNIFKEQDGKWKEFRPDHSGKYVIYKCKRCKGCLQRKCHVGRHKCDRKKAVHFKCNKCNQSYLTQYLKAQERFHKMRHSQFPDFNAKTIRIIFFDPLKKKGKDNVDDDNEENPVTKKRKTIETPKEEIKKNNTNKAKTRNTRSKVQVQSKQVESNNPSKVPNAEGLATVYKCDCGLHYTSLNSIEKHAQTCPDSEIYKENCSKCGLLFPTDILVSHLCKHHSKNSTFVVKKYEKEAQNGFAVESTSESPVQLLKNSSISPWNYEAKLYKCAQCNLYFITQSTCYRHVYKSHQPLHPSQYIECKFCSLQFTIKTLPVHISRHHQTEFNLAKVLIEEYQPRMSKGPLKIDLYVAADKVQFLQVTSSVEEKISDNEVIIDS